MKKLLHTDTPTVSINIFRVACFPVMVKNLNTTTINPIEYDKSFWKAQYRNENFTKIGWVEKITTFFALVNGN